MTALCLPGIPPPPPLLFRHWATTAFPRSGVGFANLYFISAVLLRFLLRPMPTTSHASRGVVSREAARVRLQSSRRTETSPICLHWGTTGCPPFNSTCTMLYALFVPKPAALERSEQRGLLARRKGKKNERELKKTRDDASFSEANAICFNNRDARGGLLPGQVLL